MIVVEVEFEDDGAGAHVDPVLVEESADEDIIRFYRTLKNICQSVTRLVSFFGM